MRYSFEFQRFRCNCVTRLSEDLTGKQTLILQLQDYTEVVPLTQRLSVTRYACLHHTESNANDFFLIYILYNKMRRDEHDVPRMK